ncbi:hypothetical protein [Lichenihabitans psoromatis]|uniref:hypothetical protein n=1 Tax=Lichenihabitans psoromatis TaxID=2528642 RepID=UPI001FE1A765|nr:hypothetical protein [Lichenihabitans psoromatis]
MNWNGMPSVLTRLALVAGVTFGAGFAVSAQSVKEGPFGGLSGQWSGTGTIAVSNGSNERIRCRSSYSVTPSGEALHQELRCASDSYKFEVTSNVLADANGALSGTWTENTRQVTGAVTGRVTPGQIQTSVNGSAFSATLLVSTKGGKQAVSIHPQGTDIKSIDIEMRRS